MLRIVFCSIVGLLLVLFGSQANSSTNIVMQVFGFAEIGLGLLIVIYGFSPSTAKQIINAIVKIVSIPLKGLFQSQLFILFLTHSLRMGVMTMVIRSLTTLWLNTLSIAQLAQDLTVFQPFGIIYYFYFSSNSVQRYDLPYNLGTLGTTLLCLAFFYGEHCWVQQHRGYRIVDNTRVQYNTQCTAINSTEQC